MDIVSAFQKVSTEPDQTHSASKIGALAAAPRPPGAEKLSGQDKYRQRHGDYRVLYAVDDEAATVTIVKIGHRRDVYR